MGAANASGSPHTAMTVIAAATACESSLASMSTTLPHRILTTCTPWFSYGDPSGNVCAAVHRMMTVVLWEALPPHVTHGQSQAWSEPAQPFEPAPQRLPVVTLAGEAVIPRESVVNVRGAVLEQRVVVLLVDPLEVPAGHAFDDGVVHGDPPASVVDSVKFDPARVTCRIDSVKSAAVNASGTTKSPPRRAEFGPPKSRGSMTDE